jgi:hypothetical protein
MARQFGDDPASWADLADFASDLSYADWRDEILSFLFYAADPGPPQQVVTVLRRAV